MSSKKTYLKVVNTTQHSMNITVSDVDNFDWDGSSRPDHNFDNVTIDPFSNKKEREEVNSKARSAKFMMKIRFDNGDKLNVRVNQKDGLKSYQRLYDDDKIGGSDESDYVVFQNNYEDDLNCLQITSKNWLRDVDGNKKINEIGMPGTHDSCTYTTEAKLVPYTQCQELNLKDQLSLGIRFLDIRCAQEHDKFQIHHGFVHLGLEFGKDVRDVCIDFLKKNPSEFIVMSIKKEQDPEDSELSFEQVLMNYISGYEDYFYTPYDKRGNYPRIQDVRGKIVLISRYKHPTIGIDMSKWGDNETFKVESRKYAVQDEYNIRKKHKKWDSVHSFLKVADADYSDYLCLNFCSATGIEKAALADTPHHIASYVNKELLSYIGTKEVRRYGIVIMDYPYSICDALVRAVIGTNYHN